MPESRVSPSRKVVTTAADERATDRDTTSEAAPVVGGGRHAAASTGEGGHEAEPSDEDALLAEIWAMLKTDPRRAEQLARTHQKRFPNGARSDENDALLVYAIYNQRNIDGARLEAILYYERHPDGFYTEKLRKLTGMRLSRNR